MNTTEQQFQEFINSIPVPETIRGKQQYHEVVNKFYLLYQELKKTILDAPKTEKE